MASPANLAIEVHLEDGESAGSPTDEIVEGLRLEPKRLPSKYFYDERGSRLFERITRLPEYYLTRAETGLLKQVGGAIARLTRAEELVELGAGSATKSRILIEAGLGEGSLRRYVPVEVSRAMIERSASGLAARYPQIEVHAVVGDFERHLGKVPDGGRRLIALLGSTIGNFDEPDAGILLAKVRALMEPGDFFLLGTDLEKESDVIEAAYNDAEGVTAEFNRNILHVVNRQLDANFDPSEFEHVASYNERSSRIESALRSSRSQTVRLDSAGVDVRFCAGELLHTEISCKYTRASVQRLLADVGLSLDHWFTDPEEMFALSLATPSRSGPRRALDH